MLTIWMRLAMGDKISPVVSHHRHNLLNRLEKETAANSR